MQRKTTTRRRRIHRLIEDEDDTGFSAGFISGYALSASLLIKPEFGLLTPPEMAATARTVCAATLIPIIADADTIGGNALNVQRTVKGLIAAGAAGCFLEDQAWPKKCGHVRAKQVIPVEEHAAKIASVRDAAGDSYFLLVARTDARATSAKTGLSDAISRANLYMEGRGSADLVMVNVAALLCLMVLTGLVHAATYTVGGSGGWTLNMDSWPKGKRFKAGDTLVFTYDPTIHNVVAVNRGGYSSCITPAGAKVYKSGKDQIKLSKGQNFFICNVAGHCESGMKIAINAA